VLFDHIAADTATEDRAADAARKPQGTPRAKGQAVRQALPASLPRIEHKHELQQTHCACGQARIARLYEIEREGHQMAPEDRLALRGRLARPLADALHAWLIAQRQRLAGADVTARAIDYALSNWRALTRYLDDGHVPIDNNAAENAIRPLCIGRRNWLFVGSQQAGERAAAVLSMIESAKLCGHDPWAYLKDVFERLPTLKNSDLHTLLPHNWAPAPADPGVPTTIASAA
jgi:transposase